MNKKVSNKKLVEQYSNYVYMLICEKYPTFIHEIAELYQSGIVGLISGYQNYDPNKGKVTTFCTPFIIHEINEQIRFIMKEKSEYFYSLRKEIEEVVRKLEAAGENVTIEKIMRETRKSRKIIERELKLATKTASYDTICSIPSVDFSVSDEMNKNICLSNLEGRCRKVIEMRFWKNMSFTQIAKQMNTTKYFVKKDYEEGINILQKEYVS